MVGKAKKRRIQKKGGLLEELKKLVQATAAEVSKPQKAGTESGQRRGRQRERSGSRSWPAKSRYRSRGRPELR